MLKRVYGRGLNIMGQVGPRNQKIVATFREIDSLRDATIKTIECGFMQSFFMLGNRQIVQLGYVLDGLSMVRILNYYKTWPSLFINYQKYMQYVLGETISFNSCFPEPNALNNSVFEKVTFTKMACGGSYIVCLGADQKAYGMGENVKGQLGVNSIKFQFEFQPIMLPGLAKTVDVACGYQHTLFVSSDGSVYGSGKGNRHQIEPYVDRGDTSVNLQDFYMEPIVISRNLNIVKAGGGFSHTILLGKDNKLYSMGSNKRAQCGMNIFNHSEVKAPEELYCFFTKDEKILDIKCGFHHTVVLTDKKAYFFGSNEHNQFPFPQLIKEDICSPLEIPIEGRPVKIFAGFDRTAILTQDNRCYIFGGQDLSKFGGPIGGFQQLDLEINANSNVGLGYMHTIVSV